MARNKTKTASQELDANAPVESELQTPETSELKEAPSKASIEAAINDKLSRKTDEEGENPFVPLNQLQNEVKEVAEKEGFPLNRGTEVGARLMARANRMMN